MRALFGIFAAAFSLAVHHGASAAEIDLNQFELTFTEDFDRLDVSAWGPGTRWIAHTPWNGDFGDAQFADPTPEFPFKVKDGILSITARKSPEGKWRSGLLSSSDGKGNGFMQSMGYFEIRTKLPPGPGTWPAFWLVGDANQERYPEIDVLEYYGHSDTSYQVAIHIWTNHERQDGELATVNVPKGLLTSEFNTYGVEITETDTIFYLNRKETHRIRSRPEFKRPMYILLNLALGSGWPITDTPSPSVMEVDYVRAYKRKS